MDWSAPERAGGDGPSRGLVTALAAVAGVLVVTIGVVVALIAGGRSPDTIATGDAGATVASTTAATTTRTPRTSAPATTTPVTAAARRAGPVCDARVINTDLGYPGSGSRIIDCGGGWAVMGSEISGDPYWVAYSDGRWRRVEDISMYLMTCPDEAIARGAPERMAWKHLGGCPALNPAMTTTGSSVSRTPTSSPTSSPTTSVTSSVSTSTSTAGTSSSTSSSSSSSSSSSTVSTTSSSPTDNSDPAGVAADGGA